jgi:hypothetical protein
MDLERETTLGSDVKDKKQELAVVFQTGLSEDKLRYI